MSTKENPSHAGATHADATRNAHSPPLLPTLTKGVKGLSPEARARIRGLSKPDPARFVLKLLESWLVIAVAVSTAIYFHNLWTTVLAIIVVAGRQNTFALLLHEQTHYNGIRSRWGDLVTDLFVCYPLLFVSLPRYASIHLAHHAFYFTAKDPDIHRKSGASWTFPMPMRHIIGLFMADLVGINVVRNILAKYNSENTVRIRRLGPRHGWLKPVYIAAWAIFFSITNSWGLFLLYWLLPLSTILQAFIRLGAICEHIYVPNESLETSTALIIPARWESLLFPHLNFFYHVYHHYFPGVPFSGLPKVHDIFVAEGLVNEDRIFKSITEYLLFLLSKRRATPVQQR